MSSSNKEKTQCLNIRVFGIVQGVGFRPFVRNLAKRLGVCGSVCNKGPYVDIKAQGGEHQLAAFLQQLKAEAPARSEIRKIEVETDSGWGYEDFTIIQSENSEGEVFPSPDIATCEDCKRELFDKTNRRYLHPFINCTACGPRLTILDAMPYDRAKTSMAEFEMCSQCQQEYQNPENRRYHAQPVCCDECGPELKIIFPNGEYKDPIAEVRRVLRGGGIAAVKGIGGFHLCCDAKNAKAVERLRSLKRRPFKPLAVMVKDIKTAQRECVLDGEAEKWLESPQKPIVLLPKRLDGQVCEKATPGCPDLGVFLPYAPVQLLLFDYPDGLEFTDCLVMTSGNLSGAPICRDDETALEELTPICDIILSNDREIRLRADDSVLSIYKNEPYLVRRSRGFSPLPYTFVKKGSRSVFAVGSELKNTFCFGRGDKLYLSPYTGDLSDIRCVDALNEGQKRFSNLLRIEPEVVVCDLHPGYNSTAYAKSLGLPLLQVQHHYAHVTSCMAENGLDGEVIGVSFDGVGYGTDGTIWGGEFLQASYSGFERLGSIEPFPLAGLDAASREGYRPAAGILIESCGADAAREISLTLHLCDKNQFQAQAAMIQTGINTSTCTSTGRLFDAVSAILGIKTVSTYEGEAASALEAAAKAYRGKIDELPDCDTNGIIQWIAKKAMEGEDRKKLAFQFHSALAKFVAKRCKTYREMTGLNRVVLTGGVFANRLLLGLCEDFLAAEDFEIYRHRLVPCNDGGLAMGQAAIAFYRE